MRTYRTMGEAVANAMQANIDLVFSGKCLAERRNDAGRVTDVCIDIPGHDGPHWAWGSDNRWDDVAAEEQSSG